ncbi:MAG: hypothetical protein ISP83_03070 [Candidatus Poseidonia sp.]|nr:hypothetical protein [Poseidonia sp.]MBL6805852.1 hypothetical protein [Poseidonia sp.]MBL6886694.1 hypothetical protein [Poseidonia sp.]MBL6892609.1 hypothetical protein [Poseidonia sp.]
MGRQYSRAIALLMLGLFLMAAMPLHVAATPIDFDAEQRRNTVELVAGETYVARLTVEPNTTTMVSVDCDSCEVTLEHDQASASNGQRVVLFTEDATELTLTLASSVDESVQVSLAKNISDTHPTIRPSPSTVTEGQEVGLCAHASICMDTATGTLTGIENKDLVNLHHSGILDSEHDEYVTVNVSLGDTLEWQWLETTDDVTLQMYFQNSTTETLLYNDHHLTDAFSEFSEQAPSSAWWTAQDNGRFIVRLGTSVSPTLWSANIFLFEAQTTTPLIGHDLHDGSEVLGHNSTVAHLDWNQTHYLDLHTELGDVYLQVDQLLNGNWVEGDEHYLAKGESLRTYPYPGVDGGRVIISQTQVFGVDFNMHDFSDSDGLEAPSVLPTSSEENNASWPLLNLTSSLEAEFTLGVHDTVDTYRMEVDGWMDSIHFLQFTVEGNISDLELQVWDIDQTTGEVLNTDITRPAADQLKLGLQVGRGTQYLQLRFQNSSEVTPHLWGEDVPSHTYRITSTYALVDEGEEPWFPPSEDAVFWGGFARWFLGTLFLIPVLYLAIDIKRAKKFGREIIEKKERLAWYSARLDSGDLDVKSSQKDLARALHAVAQMEWEDGMDAWGEPALHHRTEHLALAVWRVDQRIAKVDRSWPLVIGIHVIEDDWELAALRFDAPDGAAYEVVSVEPRFLHQGEEIFLDALSEGHRTFLMVELKGNAPSVDIELNGRVNNQPFAARIPETLPRALEES